MLRVVSHQPAIHELIDRAVARLGYAVKSTDEAAQNDDLRLARGLFLLALESNQLQGVEVDGQQCVIDRGGQITLIPPLCAKQFVQTGQQANVEDIETDVSTDFHRPHQHPLKISRYGIAIPVRSVRYMALMYASTRDVENIFSPSFRLVAGAAGDRIFAHRCFPEVRTSSSVALFRVATS